MAVAVGMAESFGMSGLDAEDAAGADEQRADDGDPVGHVAENDPPEESGKDDHGVVERRDLGRAGLAIGEDDEVLGEGVETADSKQEEPFVWGGGLPGEEADGHEQDGGDAEVIKQNSHGRFGFGKLVGGDEGEGGENRGRQRDQRGGVFQHGRAGFDDEADADEADKEAHPNEGLHGFAEPDPDDQRNEKRGGIGEEDGIHQRNGFHRDKEKQLTDGTGDTAEDLQAGMFCLEQAGSGAGQGGKENEKADAVLQKKQQQGGDR